MRLKPITLKQGKDFVEAHHRHNKPHTGHKFSIGLIDSDNELIGVISVGRPSARMLDDGFTAEVSRSCTLGHKNANSMLYGAAWRACKAMGYTRCVTYTQHDESGASLRAAGWTVDKHLKARKSWAESSKSSPVKRDSRFGGIERTRWVIRSSKDGSGEYE